MFCGFDACAATNPCSLWQHLAPSHAEGGSAQGFHPTACILGSNPSRSPISDGNSLNPTGSCSWESCLGSNCTPSSDCSLNCFQLGLRERLCEAKSHQTPGSPRCYGGAALLWAPPCRKRGPTVRESPPWTPHPAAFLLCCHLYPSPLRAPLFVPSTSAPIPPTPAFPPVLIKIFILKTKKKKKTKQGVEKSLGGSWGGVSQLCPLPSSRPQPLPRCRGLLALPCGLAALRHQMLPGFCKNPALGRGRR